MTIERHGPDAESGPRIGVFGLLGIGNVGNDGSFEVFLAHLRESHPDAVVDAMCPDPDQVRRTYGIPAVPLHWYGREYQTVSGVAGAVSKILGKVVDAGRTWSWVRRHDVVVVAGMGILETTLPMRPWGFPYSLFLLAASGRLARTRVALVSVGADVVRKRATRAMLVGAAHLAHFRSYRDVRSREAMRAMGVNVTADPVGLDLAFGIAVPRGIPATAGTVGVGVMEYSGGNDDRPDADRIRGSYLDAMCSLVCWLLDDGRHVRIFCADRGDARVVEELMAIVSARRPEVERTRLVVESASTITELMERMAQVEIVVATRFHSVLSAIRLSIPTLSVGYSAKHDDLMVDMGLGEFRQSARTVDVARMIEQFQALERRRDELTALLIDRNKARDDDIRIQLQAMSASVVGDVVRTVDAV